MHRALTVVLTFAAGAFFLLEFILPAELPTWLGGAANTLTPHLPLATDLVIVLATMAFLLGPINLVRLHAATVRRRTKGWGSSVVFLAFLFGSAAAAGGRELIAEPRALAVLTTAYDALFYGVMFAFGISSFGLLAFYLISAAFRAFRLNSLDAALMMLSAAVVLLGRSALGDWLTAGWPAALQLPVWQNWLLDTPNAAVQRAVVIGTFAGAFAAAMRFWLSLGRKPQ